MFSGAPEPPCVIQIIGNLSISGAPDTRIAKEFGIFSESTLLNNLQSVAKENRYQLLDISETDPAQHISNHPGIERLSMPDRVDVYRILRHGSRIQGFPEENSRVFPRSGMKFRHTSDPLSCRG
jgi:hypothetical protein